MRRYWMTLVALLAFWSAPVIAEPVFFDDFEGNVLLPHWYQPPSSYWQYNVSNSMLNVTDLFSPSSPKSNANYAWMAAFFEPQTDFQMDVWMGWEAGQQPHRLAVHVGGPFNGSPIIASMGYRNEIWAGPDPLIYAQPGDAPPVSTPAPPPGIQHFTISRTGAQFNFYFNGSPFASFPDNFGTPAAAVWFEFLGPYPGTLGAFHIDRIEVVPAPGTMALLLPLAFFCTRRSRR